MWLGFFVFIKKILNFAWYISIKWGCGICGRQHYNVQKV